MVLGSLLTSFSKKQSNNSVPFVNELNRGSTYTNDVVSYYNYKRKYMDYYKLVPELTAFINVVATDINEDFYFEPLEKGESGRNKIKKAETFAQNIQLKSTNMSIIIDTLMTGEGYGWKGMIDRAKLDKTVSDRLKERGLPVTVQLKELTMKLNGFTDEDVLKPRKYRYVASSTMENKFDDYEITGFMQRINGNAKYKEFSREEIIHFKFYDVDGRINGFTCVGSIITQLELLRFMWQNQTSIARNGGQMDKIISIEDIDINNPAYKRIETEIRKYNLNWQSRHGTLLLNGKVKVQELAQLDSMQFKEMGLYIMGVLAMQWSVPKSRISFIIGGTNNSADTGGVSELGYWHNIESFRRTYEDTINTQLFIPHFGVKFKFKDTYNHQDLLEAQKAQTDLNNVRFMNEELAKSKKTLSVEYLMNKFKLCEDDLEEYEDPIQTMQIEESQFRQELAKNSSMNKGSDGNKVSAKKKSEQDSRKKKSNGYTKELDFFDMQFKEDIEFKERQKVGFSQFVNLYNEDKAYNKTPPRVFFSERDGVINLVYQSLDFVYETSVNSEIASNSLFMNFIKLYKVDPEVFYEVPSEDFVAAKLESSLDISTPSRDFLNKGGE
jgi:hypothetical protein